MADPVLSSPPFPLDSNRTPYISSADSAGKHTVPASNWFYDATTNLWLPVTSTRGLPIVPKKSDGTEILTDAAPGSIKVIGSNAIKGAVQDVTTAGTRVQLPDYACREVTIIAKRANTGYIYVGGVDVAAALYGAELAAKDSITLAVSNTNLVYIDASVSGEGISYVAV